MRLDERRKYRALNKPDPHHDDHGNPRHPTPAYFPVAAHMACDAVLSAVARDVRNPGWVQAESALRTLRRPRPGRQRQGMVTVYASPPEALKLGDALRAAGCFPEALEALDWIAKRPVPSGVAVDLMPSDHARYLAEIDPSLTDAVALLRDARMRQGCPRIFVPQASAALLAAALRAIGGYAPTIRTLDSIAARPAPEPAASAAA